MKFTIKKAEYYKVMVSNKPGAAAKVFIALMEARVNLIGFSGFPRGSRAQLNFIPRDAAAFKKALRKVGVSPGRGKFAFLIQGPDRPGAAWDVVAKLSQAKINVVAAHAAAAGGGRYGAILWVKPRDVGKTAKVLGAS